MSNDFYKNLQPVNDFHAVANPDSYKPVPNDWWIIITDVVNSTGAIAAGRYKEVNTAGAISIAAIVNEKLNEFIPSIFGGDGITMLCPPEYVDRVKDIFFGTKDFIAKNFDLDLRIGIVSVKETRDAGFEIAVGKYCAVNPCEQAIFYGEGLDYAESLVKAKNSKHLVPEDYIPKILPDYSGFSCPFRDIKSDKGPVLALIIRRGPSGSYEKIIEELLQLLGTENEYYPLDWSNIAFGKTPAQLSAWTTVAAGSKSGLKFQVMGFLFSLIMRILSIRPNKVKLDASKALPRHSDHRKFDGTLKMVVSCSIEKANLIKDWLAEKEKLGHLIYGLHESDSSLITCLFFGKETTAELHLIDASNGGYTLAAKSLKKKMNLTSRENLI